MNKTVQAQGPFEPTLASLRTFECPEWFRDAKLGIWSHWGAQSVPMYGDWYARNMYFEGSEQNRYHTRHYGHPSVFGYKDIVQLWRAERFDPEELMDLYQAAGAKYFVAQAMHHDNFFNYDSKLHRWNSVQMGPQKDIVALWKAAADKRTLPFGLTEHLGATFSWYQWNKGQDKEGLYKGVPYDGNDPQYEDLYLANKSYYDPSKKFFDLEPWYATHPEWHQHWLDVMMEIIDLYQPDLLYSDGPLPFIPALEPVDAAVDEAVAQAGLQAVAHLYNTSAARNGGVNRAVYNQKDRRKAVYTIGVLDIERSQEPGIKEEPWQTDTCVGDWFYHVKTVYKKPGHVIEMLIDIVSKNGNLLLNIPQRPDGTIDDECRYILQEMAAWMAICSEGIYETRPFRVSGEGGSSVVIDHFKEDKVDWSASDFRFTQKGDTVYAFQMKAPEDRMAVIRTFRPEERVKRVRLLGAGAVEFTQAWGTLIVSLPEQLPTPYAHCLAIELES